jgi:NitT/TauT family transport system substrate-binding protein
MEAPTTSRRRYAAAAIAVTLFVTGLGAARAEVGEVNATIQYGIGYLPLYVMRHNHLYEKHLKQAGLDTKVTWSQIGTGSAVNDALLAGKTAFAAGCPSQLLTLWDRTRDNLKVRGVAALSSMPMYLNANTPRLKTLAAFTDQDRIAIASAGSSIETLVLRMAAAKQYGEKNYRKFDRLMVNLSHPDGMAALLSRHSITAQFTAPPYQYEKLKHPGIHRVLNSYDVTNGPATFLMVWSMTKFHDEKKQRRRRRYIEDAQRPGGLRYSGSAAFDGLCEDDVAARNDQASTGIMERLLLLRGVPRGRQLIPRQSGPVAGPRYLHRIPDA